MSNAENPELLGASVLAEELAKKRLEGGERGGAQSVSKTLGVRRRLFPPRVDEPLPTDSRSGGSVRPKFKVPRMQSTSSTTSSNGLALQQGVTVVDEHVSVETVLRYDSPPASQPVGDGEEDDNPRCKCVVLIESSSDSNSEGEDEACGWLHYCYVGGYTKNELRIWLPDYNRKCQWCGAVMFNKLYLTSRKPV